MLCPSGKLGGLREPQGALTAAQKSAEGIVEWVEQGFRLHIRRSKTDQEAAGYRIPVPLGVRLKPAATIRARIEAGEITDGHLFRQVNKGDRVLAEPLPGRSVADILKRKVAEAGYDPTLFSGHSAASARLKGPGPTRPAKPP